MPPKTKRTHKVAGAFESGKLKIGDAWSAISIIALSQNNPLKAIAEFVENSIDAKAAHITIVRGREHGEQYLKIIDDGEGVPLDESGEPNFKYVATHICDSIKKKLKKEGARGLQGEFGIGLLSFWTVGENLSLTCSGSDDRVHRMVMKKDEPGYAISARKALIAPPGTELIINPLLAGIRQLSGERIQNYLASELRDRIRHSGVEIVIRDRIARKELKVEPRQFEGLFLHDIPTLETQAGEIYPEIYLNKFAAENSISLYRMGTRVIPSLTSMDEFNKAPWNSGYLQGMIDAPFVNLTPGTRDGIIRDRQFEIFVQALATLENDLALVVEKEKQAEDEKASRDILKSVQKALKEAFLALPRDAYTWLDIAGEGGKRKIPGGGPGNSTGTGTPTPEEAGIVASAPELLTDSEERKFFDYSGPLYSVLISPLSSVLSTGTTRNYRAVCRDKARRIVENDLEFAWSLKEGAGTLATTTEEIVAFSTSEEPGICVLQVAVRQKEISCTAEAIVTVTAELVEKEHGGDGGSKQGLPSYTFQRAPGELWRSRFNAQDNIILINNAHADYLFAAQRPARKLKYIWKLYAKELVLSNFIGATREALLERMIELTLYSEEHLK